MKDTPQLRILRCLQNINRDFGIAVTRVEATYLDASNTTDPMLRYGPVSLTTEQDGISIEGETT